MASLNKVQLIGNLGKDPELRTTGGGTSVCNFTLATTDNFTDKQGNKSESTEWHNIVAWKQLAELIHKFAGKGDRLYVEGRITSRKYDAADGSTRYITEIQAKDVIFLTARQQDSPKVSKPEVSPPDDDIEPPF